MRATILNASAGSGKTYELAYKYIRDVIEQPLRYRHILAVTFTNKATEEMKSRILSKIHELASGRDPRYEQRLADDLSLPVPTVRRRALEVRGYILHDYSHFTVLTIDTFFQRILRAFIKELGIDLNYNVEIETASILAKSADALVEQITSDPELERWIAAFVDERIADGRGWDVREGILALGDELFKESNRRALEDARPKKELEKAVKELVARSNASREAFAEVARRALGMMRGAGVAATDFSGKGRSFALYFERVAAGELPEPAATVRKRAESAEGWTTREAPAAARDLAPALQPLLQELCRRYDEDSKLWNTAALMRENFRSFALLADLYAQVKLLCENENTLLLSETKNILSTFVENNDAPFIYEKVGNRYDRLMIDEFQDTSSREWHNFLPLLLNAMAQVADDERAVLIVGDIKQSIYRWRGGDWRILHEGARRELGASQTEVRDLTENWRSLPVVVEFNNRMIESVVQAADGRLSAELDEALACGAIARDLHGELRGMLARAYTAHTQTPRRTDGNPGYVTVEEFADEAPLIEAVCGVLDRGFRPKDILVLVRSSNDGRRAADRLLAFKESNRDPRYAFDVMTQDSLVIGSSPITAFVTAAFQLSVDPEDSIRRALYNRYIGDRPLDAPLPDEELSFLLSLRLLPPEEAFEEVVMRYDLGNAGRHGHEIAYLQALHEQIIAFSTKRVADLPLFLAWWAERGAAKALTVEQGERTIEVTTIHKAKGLGREVVIVPYCSWPLSPRTAGGGTIVWAAPSGDDAALGTLPLRYRKEMSRSQFSDEYFREEVYTWIDNINLLYVALTRAKAELHVMIPAARPNIGALVRDSIDTRNAPQALLSGYKRREAEKPGEDVAERLPDLEGTVEAAATGSRYCFGQPLPPGKVSEKSGGPTKKGDSSAADEPEVRHRLQWDYPTAKAQLQLRLSYERYFEDAPAGLSPRSHGILLHRLFEQAATLDEVYAALNRQQADGTVSAGEAAALREAVDRAMLDPVIRGWFSADWDEVRVESEILPAITDAAPLPEKLTRRPDRVMIRGARAVVVDYKFGELQAPRYRRQIALYMDLLRQMGYTEVEGWLWYVLGGRIERVG